MFLANLRCHGEVLLCLSILLRAEKLLFYDKVIPDDGWRLLIECLNQENALQRLVFHDVFPDDYELYFDQLARGLSSPHCNLIELRIRDKDLRKYEFAGGLSQKAKDHFLGAVATNPLQFLSLDSIVHHVLDRPESPMLPISFKLWEHMTILTLKNMRLEFPSVQIICKYAKRLRYLCLCKNYICMQCIEELAQYVQEEGNRLRNLDISDGWSNRRGTGGWSRKVNEYQPLWDALVAGQCKLETLYLRNENTKNPNIADYEILNKFADSFLIKQFKVKYIYGFLPLIPDYNVPGARLHLKLSEHRLQRLAHWPVTCLDDFKYRRFEEPDDKFYRYLQDFKIYFRHLSKHMLLIARREEYAGLGDVFVDYLRQLTMDDLKNHLHRELTGTARNPIFVKCNPL